MTTPSPNWRKTYQKRMRENGDLSLADSQDMLGQVFIDADIYLTAAMDVVTNALFAKEQILEAERQRLQMSATPGMSARQLEEHFSPGKDMAYKLVAESKVLATALDHLSRVQRLVDPNGISVSEEKLVPKLEQTSLILQKLCTEPGLNIDTEEMSGIAQAVDGVGEQLIYALLLEQKPEIEEMSSMGRPHQPVAENKKPQLGL